MKLTTLLLLLALVQVSARGYSQITLRVKNAPLEQVLESIEKQSGYVFLYNEDQLKSGKISVQLDNASIKEALNACFRNSDITFQIVEKNITLIKKTTLFELHYNFPFVSAKDTINVSGVITDSLGKPVPGVNITVDYGKGASASSSSAKGEYHVYGVPKNATIVFSSMGYTTQRVKINNRTVINVVMQASVTGLNEVTINTGIFTRKANSYTGSTLVIKGEDLKRVGNANFFQALKNISPSMVLDNFAAGSNPNALPDIQLRGTSTFPAQGDASGLKGNYLKNPNQPLFILDGFEASIERVFDLDMNRIESVTILKDAASKAIYGSKAANGVIVIETKKLISSKPLVTYNSSLDIELPDLRSYNLTNSLQKLEAEKIDGFYSSSSDPDVYIAAQALYNSRRKLALEGLDTYWLAKPLQNGVGQKHNVTVELGGSGLNIFADVSYRDVKGAMIGSDRKNISGNITTSYRVNKLLFRNIMSANKNTTQDSPYGDFSEYAQMNPYWRAVNTDGTIPFYAEIIGSTRYTNPLYNSTVNSKVGTSYFNFTNNFYLEWNLKPGLKATTRLGADIKNSDADEFYPAGHTRFDAAYYSFEGNENKKGSYKANNGKSQTLSGDLNINYTKEIGKHVLFANGGFNISEYNFREIIHQVEGFASDRMDNILFGKGYPLDSRPTGGSAINRELGFLGAFSYMYDNRFLSDLTLRTNASSQFGADKRWAKFWSFGLGWNLHNEAFLKNSSVVKLFKIRGSLGSTGNSNFLTNEAVATYGYYTGSSYQGFNGSYLLNLSNSGLQWESKFDYNAGFDANIKNLTLKFDYYQSYTQNLITDITLPGSTGFSSVKDNLGKVRNTGIELYASYLLWSEKSNFFSLNFGIETNNNKIIQLSNAMKAFNAKMDKQAADLGIGKPVKKYEDGMSMNAIWAVPSRGIDPSTGNEIYVKRDGSTTYIWDAGDMIVAGNSMPDYQGTFGFSGEYKGIGLTVTGRYLGGGQMYNQTLVDRVENVDMNYNVDERVLSGRWTRPGQNALFKRLGSYVKHDDATGFDSQEQERTRATTRFVQNRNEISIGAVNIYYLFNKNFTSKLGLQRLKLGFNMNELATFSTIKIERGTSYPYAKTLSFNLSATF